MEVAHGELSPSRDPKWPAACGSVALQFSPSSLNHAPRLLGAPALIARCSLEREDVDAKEPGYLGSSSALLMQALLLGPRQLSGSNYLLWVPPRAKLSLGFVSQTSKDLPGESSMEKPPSPSRLVPGRVLEMGLAGGTEQHGGTLPGLRSILGCGLGGSCVTCALAQTGFLLSIPASSMDVLRCHCPCAAESRDLRLGEEHLLSSVFSRY